MERTKERFITADVCMKNKRSSNILSIKILLFNR